MSSGSEAPSFLAGGLFRFDRHCKCTALRGRAKCPSARLATSSGDETQCTQKPPSAQPFCFRRGIGSVLYASNSEPKQRLENDVMTAESNTKSAYAHDRASIVWTMVLGFAADPLMRWSWPDPRQYLRSMPQFINACGGRAFEHGTAYVTGGFRAAALWLPPDVQQDEEALEAIMALSLRPEITEDMAHLRQGMAEHHPSEPHWYLPLIAVDPNWGGRGLGTLLMKYALQRCDEEGIAAYLESSNPENVPFYQRHGFKVIGEIQRGSSPPLTPMLRAAY